MKPSVKSILLAAKVGLAVLSFTLFSGFGDRFEGGFGGGFRGGFGGGFGRASGASAPKAPEDAVAGVYADLDKGVGNCLEVANLIIDESPEIRNELRKGIVEFKKILKDKFGSEDALRWSFSTVHIRAGNSRDIDNPRFGIAVCVKEADKALSAYKKDSNVIQTGYSTGGETVYSAKKVFGKNRSVIVKDMILLADDEETLESLIRVYTGSGKRNAGFDSIADLRGDAILRVLVPKLGSTVKRLGFESMVEEIAEISGDAKLKETICEFGDINLDVSLDKNNINARLDVTTANVEDAKFLESVFSSIPGFQRFALVAAALNVPRSAKSAARGLFAQFQDFLRNSWSAGRNGCTSTLSISLKTRKTVKLLAEIISVFNKTIHLSQVHATESKGRMLFQSIMAANMSLQKRGSKSVWPKTTAATGGGNSTKIWSKGYKDAREYFEDLFDVKNSTNPAKQKPYIDQDIDVLWGFGVPAPKDHPNELTEKNIMWSVAANIYDAYPDTIPVFVSANVDVSKLLIKYNGISNDRIPIGSEAGIFSGLSFNDDYAVVVYKSGATRSFKRNEFTLKNIYGHAFDVSNPRGNMEQLCYLTPTGKVRCSSK